jgi:protein O-mannosyl-transferase
MNIKNFRAALLLLPLALTIFTYKPVLDFNYLWDDWLLIGPTVWDFEHNLWIDTLLSPLPFSANYFRPLTTATFLIESAIGNDPKTSHAINLLIFILNSVIVGLLARQVWEKTQDNQPALSFSTTALIIGLYALHPANTESVAWVAGRFDLMATCFMLLGIWANFSIHHPIKKACTVSLMFFLGLLCKEMAITLPVIIFLLNWGLDQHKAPSRTTKTANIYLYSLLSLGLAAYVGVRMHYLGYFLTTDPYMPDVPIGTPLERLLLIGAAYADYWRIMLMPLGYTGYIHFTHLPIRADNLLGWAGWGLFFMTALVCTLLRKRQIIEKHTVALLLALIVSLLPLIHITKGPMLMANSLSADRGALFPLCLLVIIATHSFEKWLKKPKPQKIGIICTVALALLFMLSIRVNLPAWGSDRALWLYTTNLFEDCGVCVANLGYELQNEDPDKALELMEKGISLAEQPWLISTTRLRQAHIYISQKKDYQAALTAMHSALEADKDPGMRATIYNEMATTYILMGDKIAAYNSLKNAIDTNKLPKTVSQITLIQLAIADNRPDIAHDLLEHLRTQLPSATLEYWQKKIAAGKL